MKKIIYITIFIISLICLYIFIPSFNKEEQKKVLKFSSWGSQSETQVINSVIKDFELKNQNIKVEFLHIPQNYFQKIHLLFASNLEPDVIFINNQNIPMYINANLLEDLTPYFDEKIFFNEALNCFKNNNKLYAIPRDISNLVIYYNKDIFKKQNVQPLNKIKSLEDLKNLAEKLTTKENFGINYEEDPLFYLYYLASNGGGFLSDDKKSIIINSEKSLEALNLYSDFINKYHIAPTKSQIGSMTTAQMFINGKLAMYLGGRWLVPKFREAINFDWDIMEFPSTQTNKVYIDSSGWAVSKKSKNKKEAIELIKYLSSKETIDKFTQSGLILPARIDSANSEVFLNKNLKPKHSEIFIDMLKFAKPTPVNENYGKINDILKEKTQKIFNSEKKSDEIIDKKTIKELESLL
jgi:multiple sugar transport system substrate-binding protein